MAERLSRWMSVFGGSWRAGLLVAAGLLAGCGTYEPEPEFPQNYQYAPPPLTADELAAQQRAHAEAQVESREILIGADGDEYADTDPSALTEFRTALDEHGTWVEDATYGTVWVPSPAEVGSDFQPYVTAGHWTYSEETDYVWVSDYSWGWAPFHYGRWVHLPGHGWSWIPGRRYAGAWVTWRVGPAGYGYVGWAPAPPEWYWYRGVAIGWTFGWYRPYDYYVYCPHTRVYGGPVATYVVRGRAAREHYGRTRDYVPASPSASGGGRVVANPSVSGGGRVVANPAVGGERALASPRVARGPRPDEIGSKDAVVPPPASHQGLGRAQALATPTTAVAAGAAAPAQMRGLGSAAPSAPMDRPATSAFAPATPRGIAPPAHPNASAPAFAPGARPHVAQGEVPRFAPAAPAPTYRADPSPSFRSPPAVAAPTYRSPAPSTSAPAPRSTPSFRSPTPSTPSFRSSAPAVRSSPPPSFRSPSSSSSTPSFRSSAPAVRSSPPPSFRSPSSSSSPSSRSSAPAVRSSPSPSFRSSAPAVRSSPSPSFRSSAPAVRSSPSVSSKPSRSSSPAVRTPSLRKR